MSFTRKESKKDFKLPKTIDYPLFEKAEGINKVDVIGNLNNSVSKECRDKPLKNNVRLKSFYNPVRIYFNINSQAIRLQTDYEPYPFSDYDKYKKNVNLEYNCLDNEPYWRLYLEADTKNPNEEYKGIEFLILGIFNWLTLPWLFIWMVITAFSFGGTMEFGLQL